MRREGHACWLLDCIGGRFDLLLFDAADDAVAALSSAMGDTVRVTRISTDARRSTGELHDAEGLAAQRYGARPGTAYLLRPDQHVAARWRSPSVDDIRAALRRAQGLTQSAGSAARDSK
jgi:3-(3-hydroxy-phenyl)propionate hydroxylase